MESFEILYIFLGRILLDNWPQSDENISLAATARKMMVDTGQGGLQTVFLPDRREWCRYQPQLECPRVSSGSMEALNKGISKTEIIIK